MPPYQSAVTAVTPRRRSLETISVLALFATLAVSLFAFIPSTTVPLAATKTFVLAAGVLITLALYILARLARGNVILPPSILIGALWLPVLAYVLSSVFSGIPFTSALWGTMLESDTLGFMLIAAVLGTLAALMLRHLEQIRFFLQVCAWAFGAVVAVELLIVIVGQVAPSTISPSFSVVGSFRDLASLLGLGVIGILITLREVELSERTRRMLLISGAGALVLIASANVSLVWVLLALASLGLFVESVMQRRSHTADSDLDDITVIDEQPLTSEEGSRSLVLPLAILAISLFFLIGGTLGSALAQTLHVNELNVRPSWQSTYLVAQKTFSTAPVFGTGPGTFGVEWLKYRDAALNSTVFWNLDFSSGIGFIPTSVATTGLVGVLAWIAFFALFIFYGVRMLVLRTPQDTFARYAALLSFIASIYLFVLAIFDLPNVIILALMFLFAGVFISMTRFGTGSSQFGVIFSRSPRLGFIIVFSLTILLLASVVTAYALVGHYIATTQLASARAAFASGNLDAADAAAQTAISFAPSAGAYQISASTARERLGQIVNSTTMPLAEAQKAFQTTLSSGISVALTATNLAPSDYQNWLVLGNLYSQAVPLGVTGAYDSAKAAYAKAQELNPTNPQIPFILAQLDVAHRDIKAAKEDLKAAITLKQDYTPAIFLLSQLEVQDGNVKEALDAALAAAYFTPNDPSILLQVGILRAASNDLPGAVEALSASISANGEFANARYFLAAVYAKQGNMSAALAQLQAIAALSSENATTIAPQITALKSGKNPFPANLLTIPSTP